MCDVTDVAQAKIDEIREISGTLEKDQRYYFRIRVTKYYNGVSIEVTILVSTV